MGEGPELQTERLLLRRWRESDLAPFAAQNADPLVMEYFPALLDGNETRELVNRIEHGFARDGYGFWAVEVIETAALAGFIGICPVGEDLPFAPAVEIGWRLAREYWGQGLASEGARAAADFAFGDLGLGQIVAYTTERNTRSRRVMERLGMHHDPEMDFLHPRIAADDPLAPHVLYRLNAPGDP